MIMQSQSSEGENVEAYLWRESASRKDISRKSK